jgi:uncharacterized protein
MMKIAIIGSGVSGLTSAYLLAEKADVTLYEANSELGGHANTHTAIIDGKHIPVDTGFMVYNPERYPNFVELLKRLDVKSQDTEMTFSAYIPDEVTYVSYFPRGIFVDIKNLFRIRFLRFLLEIVRFRKISLKVLEDKSISNDVSLEDYFKKNNFSSDLYSWYLVPQLSAIWSCPDKNKIAQFPALSTLVFLNNHKLLSQFQPTWKTIVGGSVEYVTKIESYLSEKQVLIHKNTPVMKVTRTETGAIVESSVGQIQYDLVVFATHAKEAKEILSDKTPEEEAALSCFGYSKNTTVLHSDARLLPKNKKAWAAWNYAVHKENLTDEKIVFTYNMNILQHIDKKYPLYVTLNSPIEIEKKLVHGMFDYEHPVYNLDSLRGQKLVSELQGKNKILYTGAHLGFGFHEDGVVSAIDALSVINILPPWQVK